MVHVNYEPVDSSFQAFLETNTGRGVGLAKLPTSTAVPYAIVYPMTSGMGDGSYADPEEDRELLYQLTCVGETPQQARWMSDKVRRAILGRNSSGAYLYTMTLTGVNVQRRSSDMLGSILPSGADLYQIADTYRLLVGA